MDPHDHPAPGIIHVLLFLFFCAWIIVTFWLIQFYFLDKKKSVICELNVGYLSLQVFPPFFYIYSSQQSQALLPAFFFFIYFY